MKTANAGWSRREAVFELWSLGRQECLGLSALTAFVSATSGPTEEEQITHDRQACSHHESGQLLQFQHGDQPPGTVTSLPTGMMGGITPSAGAATRKRQQDLPDGGSAPGRDLGGETRRQDRPGANTRITELLSNEKKCIIKKYKPTIPII